MNPHLVIFHTEESVISARWDFKNIPPSLNEIMEIQKEMKRIAKLDYEPTIVNWLPITD